MNEELFVQAERVQIRQTPTQLKHLILLKILFKIKQI